MSSELAQLTQAIDEIWAASESTGLDPFPIHFEIVPASVMYEIGAYGLPGRFSHWTHGKAFHQMKTMYDYGLSKIYELIINTNPAQAFLMEGNSLTQNKLVIAHVIGHSDFFKCNAYFQHTNRQMAETAGVTAERIRAYEQAHGEREVEEFLDAVLSIQEHIDPNLRIRRPAPPEKGQKPERRGRRTTQYDDLWLMSEKDQKPLTLVRRKSPEEPEKDLLLFLLEHAPEMEDWQRDVLNIVRNEMLYFLPQMQTKTMNEGWACATGESLLATEKGFVRFRDLYAQRGKIAVGSGGKGALHPITDFHREERVATLRITTRRGYTIEGALKHRVQLADGSWAFLKDLKVGDRVALACGTEVWAKESSGNNHSGNPGASLEAALNSVLAHVLGYGLLHARLTEDEVRLIVIEEAYARRLAHLGEDSLGVVTSVRAVAQDGVAHFQVTLHSAALVQLIEKIAPDWAAHNGDEQIPDAVLRAPREVMSAFLGGFFDAASEVDADGLSLECSGTFLAKTVRVVLLNYGILTQEGEDGDVALNIRGSSAAQFREVIGLREEGQRRKLDAYLEKHGNEAEEPVDEIVWIWAGQADVFDITVDVAHAYVANGFVNHNSYWHSRILREMDLRPDEHIEFTRLHASVLSPSPRGTSINPYYVGFKILEDIERRWNGDLTADERREYLEANHGDWPHRGRGREKMFEVRELENDVSFLRNYLTRHLVDELDMYIYHREGDEWVVAEKDWRKVRDAIVESMTNFGFPYLVVEDGDYHRARELYLRHCSDDRGELDQHYAFRTLRYLYKLWGRPIHLETVVDGDTLVWTFDGEKELVEPAAAS
jgi:stage V sporulation protein R